MKRWSALAALLLAFAAALALRLPHLSARPLHNDEAVNAFKVTELLQTGRYVYDPDEYHGPALHYAALPFLWLSGVEFGQKNGNTGADNFNETTLRLPTVFFGAALILLLLLFKDGLPKGAMFWTALFLAISPAMVFYSRYFIHEMLLVFFSTLSIGAGWRYVQTREAVWAAVAGGSVGLMYATKETFVLTVVAIVVAGGMTRIFVRVGGRSGPLGTAGPTFGDEINGGSTGRSGARGATRPTRHALIAVGAFVLVWLLFFSSFFTNFHGLADSVRTYLPWLKRAGGHSPHIHPWYFYLQRLAWFHPAKGPVWSEGLILGLAFIGMIVSVQKKKLFPTFLTFYTLILTAIYSAISYKTPWCLLNFLFGMILLAGIGASALINAFSIRFTKIFASVALLALSAQLAAQAYRASYVYVADRRNPYVYAQTSPDLLNLVQRVEAIARIAPANYETVIKVITADGDYWPLPWYLRRFKNVGWYEKVPENPFAPMMIVAAQLEARYDEKSDKKWIMVGYTELRPQKFLELYVEADLWKKYVATLPRDRE
jgi:uncharacterized protein (TIGR03663 family)